MVSSVRPRTWQTLSTTLCPWTPSSVGNVNVPVPNPAVSGGDDSFETRHRNETVCICCEHRRTSPSAAGGSETGVAIASGRSSEGTLDAAVVAATGIASVRLGDCCRPSRQRLLWILPTLGPGFNVETGYLQGCRTLRQLEQLGSSLLHLTLRPRQAWQATPVLLEPDAARCDGGPSAIFQCELSLAASSSPGEHSGKLERLLHRTDASSRLKILPVQSHLA
jgi:hypothetical protein